MCFVDAGGDRRLDGPELRVHPALREAALLAGADKNALVAELRGRFVNLPAEDATIREISIRQMLQDAIPQKLRAESDDALSLSGVLYAEQLLKRVEILS